MATSPQFTSIPNCEGITLSTANSIQTIITAGSNGSRLDRVFITATSTTSAGNIRLYVSGKRIKDVPVKAITATPGVANFMAEVTLDIVLANGQTLQASSTTSDSFDVVAISGDF